jgi:hypothetical protein
MSSFLPLEISGEEHPFPRRPQYGNGYARAEKSSIRLDLPEAAQKAGDVLYTKSARVYPYRAEALPRWRTEFYNYGETRPKLSQCSKIR